MKLNDVDPFEINKCYFGDSLKLLKKIPDKSFDLVLTDPPYNINCHLLGVENKKSKKIAYNDKKSFIDYWNEMETWFEEAIRIAPIVIFTPGYTNFREWLRRYDMWYLFWYNPGRQGCCIPALINKVELILIWGIEKRKQLDRFSISTIKSTNDMSIPFIHPCPRNIEVWRWIIEEMKSKRVLDPFAGSGVTAQACIELGIDYMLIEINESYKPDIEKRIRIGRNNARYKQTKII